MSDDRERMPQRRINNSSASNEFRPDPVEPSVRQQRSTDSNLGETTPTTYQPRRTRSMSASSPNTDIPAQSINERRFRTEAELSTRSAGSFERREPRKIARHRIQRGYVEERPFDISERSERLFAPISSAATGRNESDHGEYRKRYRSSADANAADYQRSDTRRSQRNKRKTGRTIRRFIGIFITLSLLCGVGFLGYKVLAGSALFETVPDYDGTGTTEVAVEIPKGATGGDIAKLLLEKNVVASIKAFQQAFNNNPEATSIQPGLYTLHEHMNAKLALQSLLNPKSKVESKVTYIEGQQLKTFIKRLKDKKLFPTTDIDAALADPVALGVPAYAKGNPEGWFAPDTYIVPPKMTVKELFTKMVSLTKKRLKDLKIPEDQWETALIKASIIEREVRNPDYYGKVARVIENRLSGPNESGGTLGMDSTILYGLGREAGSITKSDLEKDTPYNTRLHKGLPPTPIGSVGLAALKAVANPPAGQWLYFVTVNPSTGETRFSNTNSDFQKDVAEYRKYCTQHPENC